MASFVAKHRFARISASKARPIARLIQGMPVVRALETLKFSPKRSAAMIDKVLRSALGNAGINADELVHRSRGGSSAAASAKADSEAAGMVVASVRIDGGPIAIGTKRFIPVSRGMAHPIRKRTSHITVVVEQVESQEE
jgi:large subunit ribosomal protein L22